MVFELQLTASGDVLEEESAVKAWKKNHGRCCMAWVMYHTHARASAHAYTHTLHIVNACTGSHTHTYLQRHTKFTKGFVGHLLTTATSCYRLHNKGLIVVICLHRLQDVHGISDKNDIICLEKWLCENTKHFVAVVLWFWPSRKLYGNYSNIAINSERYPVSESYGGNSAGIRLEKQTQRSQLSKRS